MSLSNHHHHQNKNKNLGITIALNLVITIAQAIGGFISGSVALLSDAVHNFSDVLSLVISYLAHKLSHREASEKYTFGQKRSEIMAAFFNSATLIVLSFFIIYQAIMHLIASSIVVADYVIYLALLSIFVNGISVLLIKKDADHSINMKSAYLHLFSDMLTSIAVLFGGLAMKYFQWYWIDPIFSFGIAIYLLYLSWDILKISVKILMQHTPENIDLHEIVHQIEQIKGIKNLHHIHIWQLNDHDIMFESHVDLDQNYLMSDFEIITVKIKTILQNQGITHSTLQPEFEVDDNKDLIHSHH